MGLNGKFKTLLKVRRIGLGEEKLGDFNPGDCQSVKELYQHL